MNSDAKPNTAGLIRAARHPAVRAVAKCALMCALGANLRDRHPVKHDKDCCP